MEVGKEYSGDIRLVVSADYGGGLDVSLRDTGILIDCCFGMARVEVGGVVLFDGDVNHIVVKILPPRPIHMEGYFTEGTEGGGYVKLKLRGTLKVTRLDERRVRA